MLWRGQCCGNDEFDELRALSYLASRPEVDPARWELLGCLWGHQSLVAGRLDPRVAWLWTFAA